MKITHTDLAGVFIIEPEIVADSRGYTFVSYHEDELKAAGVSGRILLENHLCTFGNVIRGLHYQLEHPQAKMCKVVVGEILDVVADVRRGSPTFGRSLAITLTASSGSQIFIPRGCAHGVLALGERAEMLYGCDDYYWPGDEKGVAWNDPVLAIDWGVTSPILSDRDRLLRRLEDIPESDLPGFADNLRSSIEGESLEAANTSTPTLTSETERSRRGTFFGAQNKVLLAKTQT